MNALSRYADPVFCLMRLIVGLTFACHGGQKLLGFPPNGHGAGQGVMLLGAWIELCGGFLIAFGLVTRVAAFIASGEMAVAWFMFHFPHGVFAEKTPVNGESAVVYCFVFFFIFFYGPGQWSIDSLISRGKTAAASA